MLNVKRREFVRLAGSFVAASLLGFPYIARGAGGKVVIIGGGSGGATAAKYIRLADPSVDVTLIEPATTYQTGYLSNEVLVGIRNMQSLTFDYTGLQRHGVKIVHDRVIGIDPVAKKATTANGSSLSFDRAIVAPGVDFKWDAIEGYTEQTSAKAPHAWKAGPQTLLLQQQLSAMRDGGVVLIVAPANPYRCPPGPYERASLIAQYLQQHKPKSKIIILDAKDAFSKQPLFTQAWTKLYGFATDNSLIQWIGGAGGGKVESFDAANMTVQAEFDEFQGDVISIIPPQKAGHIAVASGLVEGDWCPVNKRTFESTKQAGIYVIGDASSASTMPKSAYAANAQAKIAAAAIVDTLGGREPKVGSYMSTCYSLAGENYGFSVAGVYRLSGDGSTIEEVPGSGGTTPVDASSEVFRREAIYAHSWFKNITQDIFG